MGVEGGIRTGKQETVAWYKSWLALNVVYVWVLVYEEHVHSLKIKNYKKSMSVKSFTIGDWRDDSEVKGYPLLLQRI